MTVNIIGGFLCYELFESSNRKILSGLVALYSEILKPQNYNLLHR